MRFKRKTESLINLLQWFSTGSTWTPREEEYEDRWEEFDPGEELGRNRYKPLKKSSRILKWSTDVDGSTSQSEV